MNTNPRNLIMIDYARHDKRSAAVRSLDRAVVPFAKDIAETPVSTAGAKVGAVVTAGAGLAIGILLVLLLRAG